MGRHRLAAAAVMAVGALTATIAAQYSSADWPQYRGPTRDGSTASFTPPPAWPDQLVRRWTVEVGAGYAAPVVVGNRVYVFSRRGGNETMAALDAGTGRELWQTGYPAPFTMHSATVQHGMGPKSTPVFANGVLLSIGMTGVVTAFDASSGRQLWQKPGTLPVPLYTTHSFSPLADRGLAVFHVGGHDKGALTAFEIRTGAVKWSWGGDGPGYGSPIVAEFDGTRQIVAISQTKVVGVDVENGALLWERPFPAVNITNSNTPLVHGRHVIVSGNGGPTTAFSVTKAGGRWTTATVWENADVPLRMTNAVLAGTLLFGLANRNSGQYFGVDAETGRTLWTSPGRQAANAAIARSGNLLFSLEDDGELVVARASRSAFELVKKYKVADQATWAEPALSGNRVFVKDSDSLALWTIDR